MFQKFHQLVQQEIQKKGFSSLFKDLFNLSFQQASSPPSTELLWKNFLSITLKKTQFINAEYLFLVKNSLLPKLQNLTEYTTENDLHLILDHTLFKYLDDIDKSKLISKIQNFQFHLKHWISGRYHQKLIPFNIENVQFIKETLQFDSLWDSSIFLFKCGYPYFQGKTANQAWNRFQGKASSFSFASWSKQLSRTDLSHLERLQLDVSLETFFSGANLLFFQGFECNLKSCPRCPLTDNCEFYRIHYSKESLDHLRVQVEAGNIKGIKTVDLIQFLLKSPPQVIEKDMELTEIFTCIHSDNLHDFKSVPASIPLLIIKEIGRRNLKKQSSINRQSFTSSQAVYSHFENIIKDEKQESFFTLLLDNKNKVIAEKLITRGILDQSLVHPREVFASAIQARAASIILVHNHPSGVPTPSRQDINITRRLYEVGEVVGIKVLDHVIMGDSCHYSFVDQDIMPGTS